MDFSLLRGGGAICSLLRFIVLFLYSWECLIQGNFNLCLLSNFSVV